MEPDARGSTDARLPFMPADVRLALRMAGWALLLPLLKRLVPIKQLAPLMWTESRRERSPEVEREIVRLSFALARLRPPRFQSNCLVRSLLAYRFFSELGADPHLVIAVSASEGGLFGHAWVTVDDRAVHDSDAATSTFRSIAEFGARGLPLEGGPDGDVGDLKTWV